MYPLTLIRLSRKKRVTLQLADNQVVSGYLASCDLAMNLYMQNVTVTKADGASFFTKECYLRGQGVKFVKIDTRIMEKQHLFN